MTVIPFGRQFRKEYFDFDQDYLPLNHGSFGASPKVVMDFAAEEKAKSKANPDLYLRYDLNDRLAFGLAPIAQIMGANPKNLAFVPNATTGINAVLRSLPFKKGDVIIYANTTYGACINTIRFLENLMGVIPYKVTLNYPMSSNQVVAEYATAIEESKALGRVKMLFFDTVSSIPAFRLPWERLVKLAKDNGLLSMVDGAHCIGLLTNVSLDTVQPDFFVTNIHKWFFAPTPAALLYLAPQHHRTVQTLPISHSYIPDDRSELSAEIEENLLHYKFGFIGTADYANYVASAKAFEFRRDVCGGEEAIAKYCYNLAKSAAKLFADELDGEIIGGSGEDDMETATSMISLSISLPGVPEEQMEKATAEIQETLVRKHNVFIPVYAYRGRATLRLSSQIYVEMLDFEDGLKALKQVIKDYENTLSSSIEKLQV